MSSIRKETTTDAELDLKTEGFMVAYLDQMVPVLGSPGVWQDLPWISRERNVAPYVPPAPKQVILDEFEGSPPVALSDSALWAQHDCWDL